MTANAIKAHFAQQLPGIEVVIADSLAAMAVYKPDGAPVPSPPELDL